MGVTTTSVWDSCSVRFYILECAVKDEVRVKQGCREWSIGDEHACWKETTCRFKPRHLEMGMGWI